MKKLIEDINLAFPLSIDKTPEGKIVPCAEVGEEGYGANINYTLQITYQNNRAIVLYYGEDGSFLDGYDVFKAMLNLMINNTHKKHK